MTAENHSVDNEALDAITQTQNENTQSTAIEVEEETPQEAPTSTVQAKAGEKKSEPQKTKGQARASTRTNQRSASARDKTRQLRKKGTTSKIKQAKVILGKGKPVHLDSRTSTRVLRLNDAAHSKCVVNLTVTIHSQHAQRLLERNFQYVSWSADKIAEYIQRNLRNEKIVQFEEIVDQESSKIAQKLDEGIAYFTEHVQNLESSIQMSSHYTCPVQYELPIESNSACRFVRLVMQFDQLCHLLDVLTISDQFGDGANVKLANEVRKWRNLINGMTNLITGTQREARELITTNMNAVRQSGASKSLLEAAKVAEIEEKAFTGHSDVALQKGANLDVEDAQIAELQPHMTNVIEEKTQAAAA